MPLDLLALPDDVLLMIMSYGDNASLLALRAANSRFNGLLLTYPRQICDQIITAHFGDPFIAHFFQEPTDLETRVWGLRSRFDGFPYHIRQLRRFPAICEYAEAVDDIMRILSTRVHSIRGQHFSIRGRRRPGSNTRRWVLIYFAMLYHHNTIDLSFLQLHRYWPAAVPPIYSPAWEEAVDWVERVLMARIWKIVSAADMSVASIWSSPSEVFPLLRTFVRHTHPAELEAVMNSCYSLERTGVYDRNVMTTFRAKMLPYGDVCETWTRLYKGTIHDKNIV